MAGNLAAYMALTIDRRVIYWATQFLSWSGYMLVIGLNLWLKQAYMPGQGYALLLTLAMGVGASHLLRSAIREHRWLQKPLGYALPRMVFRSLVLGTGAALVQLVLHRLFFPARSGAPLDLFSTFYELLLNWTILLLAWGGCYFAYHWFIRSRREEIRNLRLENANREGQLANLRAQLNPHFMFNALNGIRGLIDEDPVRAKESITQLSAILRNAMTTVKRRTVPLGEEIDIVKSYLALESMRFEERLRVQFDIDPALEREPVPPMLLQTLVENAVRHGIARLTQGGEVNIAVQRGLNGLVMSVSNSGTYVPGEVNGTGIGLEGTRHRLELIYGERAQLHIANKNGMVVTEVEIPMHALDTTNTPTP